MEQLISMELDHTAVAALKAMTPEAYAAILDDTPFDLPVNQAELIEWMGYKGVGALSDAKKFTDLGLTVRLSRVRGSFLEELPKLGAEVPPAAVVNVVIPNAALFSVTELMVHENECTDVINGRLQEGWRIVAVCPPNDTRRPTYILGRMGS